MARFDTSFGVTLHNARPQVEQRDDTTWIEQRVGDVSVTLFFDPEDAIATGEALLAAGKRAKAFADANAASKAPEPAQPEIAESLANF